MPPNNTVIVKKEIRNIGLRMHRLLVMNNKVSNNKANSNEQSY